MPEILLRKPGFTYSSCGPFARKSERIAKLKKISDLSYIYANEWDKICFTRYAAYAGSKEFAKRTILNKILRYRAYEISLNPKTDGYQKGLASMSQNFLDKKTASGAEVNVNGVLSD